MLMVTVMVMVTPPLPLNPNLYLLPTFTPEPKPSCAQRLAEPADSQATDLLAELPSCSPAAEVDVPMVAGLVIALDSREPRRGTPAHRIPDSELLDKVQELLAGGARRRKAAQSGGFLSAVRAGLADPDAPPAALELHKPDQAVIRAGNGGFASSPGRKLAFLGFSLVPSSLQPNHRRTILLAAPAPAPAHTTRAAPVFTGRPQPSRPAPFR
jgi:hypothetical protein